MSGFVLLRRPPPPHLRGVVVGLADYRERGSGASMCEAASLVVPLIVSTGTPFAIGLGGPPAAGDARHSFAAGLHAGPVHITSDGGAAATQADLHPLAAFRLLRGATAEVSSAMVPLADLFGRDGRDLVEAVANAATPDARLGALAAFVSARLGPPPSAGTAAVWHALEASGGTARVEAVARSLGVSRKRLSARFAAEVGVGPKTAARLLRFARARRLAAAGQAAGWADVAAAAGFADQSHLAREFVALAGEPPTAWAARVAADPVVHRAA